MKKHTAFLAAAAVLSVLMTVEAVQAHGGPRRYSHGPRVGVFIGAPIVAYGWHSYGPWYPYYPYPPAHVVVRPPPPPVYIERAPESAAGDYWYYCPDTKAYYPYVGSCASPWERVAPQPPRS